MSNILSLLVFPHFLVAIFILLLPFKRKLTEIFVFFVVALGFLVSIFLFLKGSFIQEINIISNFGLDFKILLRLQGLAKSIICFVNLFGLLISLFSFGFIQKKQKLYYSLILFLIGFANLVLLAADFLVFLFAWAAILVILYFILLLYNPENANYSISLLGFSDFLLLLGVVFYVICQASFAINPQMPLKLSGFLPYLAFFLLLSGSLAKAGSFPFSDWIPKVSEDVPPTIMAILPASLDKLLGIYFLAKISTELFILNNLAKILLLSIGSITVIFAVFMALLQHDLRKLLSFHAISQVGYMVLGFGAGTTLGIVGGIFHMFNHSLYKSGLFLSAAGVGKTKNTYDLDELGGLSSVMPFSFFCTLIFSLSISGIPPFNGFASKWLIYQGIISAIDGSDILIFKFFCIIALLSAMFASALTLASFIKLLNGVFFGTKTAKAVQKNELSIILLLPLVLLALLCVLMGIFAESFVKNFIIFSDQIKYLGIWNSYIVFALMFFTIFLGAIIGFSLNKKSKKIKTDKVFIGAETSTFNYDFPATEFYKTLEDLKPLKKLLNILKNEKLELINIVHKIFDFVATLFFIFIDRLIYSLSNLVGYAILGISWILRKIHSGELNFYILLSIFGFIIINFYLLK